MEKELPIYRLDIVEDLDSNVEVDFVAWRAHLLSPKLTPF